MTLWREEDVFHASLTVQIDVLSVINSEVKDYANIKQGLETLVGFTCANQERVELKGNYCGLLVSHGVV